MSTTKEKPTFAMELLTSLAREVDELKRVADPNMIPKGLIAIWGKSEDTIPMGWEPVKELQGYLPVGYKENDPDFGEIGKYKNERTHTLTVEQIPSHNHVYSTDHNADRRHNLNGAPFPIKLGENTAESAGGGTGTGNLFYTSSTGDNKSFSILNPYKVVHFIRYIGIDELGGGKKKLRLQSNKDIQ